ncbi:HAMP domain-containing protein [Thermoleophilum album]|uniref:HAMP domain-containing sensor histidine kinase n=1 Tax=Thermoleophilum album TaxID=29539 RepID=UPI00237D1014|nr:histidine kinase [Thermoleophilum album]WDT93324.1 HAMP domain-containing protein [Thermoleophilum album]
MRGAEPAPGDASSRRRTPSLFRRVFAIVAAVLLIDAAVFAFGPESRGVGDALSSLAGFVLVLVVVYWLMRRAFAPLRTLAQETAQISSLVPGKRVTEGAAVREVAALQTAFNAMLERLEEAQRASARAQLDAQEEERRRVARELHDEIGQGLTTALLLLRHEREGADPQVRDRLDEARAVLKDTLHGVRRILAELRPESLEELGLGSALMNLARRVTAASGIEVRVDLPPTVPRLPRDVELVVFRTAQEALTNVLKHSEARSATVTLDVDDSGVRLQVDDDGRGIAPGASGRGTVGMAERAFAIGGWLTVSARPDGPGTRVVLTVPRERAKPVDGGDGGSCSEADSASGTDSAALARGANSQPLRPAEVRS